MSASPNVRLLSFGDREPVRRAGVPAAISVANLAFSVRKRSGETLAILDNIDLTVGDSEFVALVGTTLRKSIANQIGTFRPEIVPDMVAKNAELLGKAGNIQPPVPPYEAIVDGAFKPLWKAGP